MSADAEFLPSKSSTILDDVVTSLSSTPKHLPSKYFYDARGSELFNAICELDEYYPTRTEIEITKRHAPDIAGYFGEAARLVELGAGDGIKTRHIVRHIRDLSAYVPVDISPTALERCARSFSDEFPSI